MSRYFLEVAYRGTAYSGFQVQENAPTIQAEIEKAFATIHRQPVQLTGSSRTDGGVHALQNFFHFDFDPLHPQLIYKINAILPADIAVRQIIPVRDDAHCRFDAISRKYHYHLHSRKDPFKKGISLFFPYRLDMGLLHQAAAIVKEQHFFGAFSKTNTQVKNFNCTIYRSEWVEQEEGMQYIIEGNRFLRGMVRLLTGTMLKVGRGKLELRAFEQLFLTGNKCGFSVPADGLFLAAVRYPENFFD